MIWLASSFPVSKCLDSKKKAYSQIHQTMPDKFSSIQDSIKNIAESFGRFVLIGSTAFGMASFANLSHHKSYWNGTIDRVQTVDFNMLAHMLPTKLSQAIIEGDEQEIQRTLDSNYGLFGLVITDCRTSRPDCDQTMQYASNSELPWRNLLSDDTLAASTYDVLRDPPPLYPVGDYADSRDPARDPTGLTNFGAIIGRVYYVRGVPPGFLATYSRWIKAWPASFLSESGANRYYSLTTVLFGIGGLSAWIFMELGFSKRRRWLVQSQQQNRQSELAQAELTEDIQDSRQQLEELVVENSRLIEERSRNISELEQARKRYRSQEVALRDSFQKQKSRQSDQEETYIREQQRQTDLQAVIQQQQQEFVLLEKEIAKLQAQNRKNVHKSQLATGEKIDDLLRAQAEKQKKIDEHKTDLGKVRQELSSQTEKIEEQNQLVELLRQEIEESERRQAEVSLRQEESLDLLQKADRERARDKQRIDALEAKLRDEKMQGDELRTMVNTITGKSLNLFERKILHELKGTSKVRSAAWSIHPQFDVSRKRQGSISMLTDCIVVGNSFVAVIEAKSYSGRIHTEGDTRNSVWLNSEGRKSMEIKSSWGNNPYKQVSTYVQNAMGLFESNFNQSINFIRKAPCKEVSFYGIVVFPDGADLTTLDIDLGKLYRVTLLKDLVDVLHNLERQTRQFHTERGHKGLSAIDIENCLHGRYEKKSPKVSQRSAA